MPGEGRGKDFTIVTETPGIGAPEEQLARLYTRYRFASEYCKDKDVLEAACGAGIGLGYIARRARTVIGGDIDEKNLKFARETYQGRQNVKVKHLDAHSLPFGDRSFDVVILYEAIYYLSEPHTFVREALRVLRNGGALIICSANKEWSGFNPSPYSHQYFSAPELFQLLSTNGFLNVVVYGDCLVKADTAKDMVVAMVKQVAVALHLIPKTMKGKEWLKRLFMGKLRPLPRELDDSMAVYSRPVEISHEVPNGQYKVLYAVGYAR
jgi:ubiquinone/menaquinone biosynthesis C-methylase UbiE